MTVNVINSFKRMTLVNWISIHWTKFVWLSLLMAGQFNIVFLCHGALPTAIWIIVIIDIFKPQLEHWSCNYIYRPISDSVRDQFDSIPLLLRQKVNTPERVYLCRPCLVRCVCDTSTLCLFTWSSLTQPKSRPIL